ncbi:MAG: amino acid transporter, partial [Myxococcales bacterium]
ALYASYGLPIWVVLRARRSGRWTRVGPCHLGRCSTAVNVAALLWIVALTILFVLPPNQVAGYTFAGALALFCAWWFVWMRSRFKGPPVGDA